MTCDLTSQIIRTSGLQIKVVKFKVVKFKSELFLDVKRFPTP